MLGIGLPVRRQMQETARAKTGTEQGDKARLDQPPLVVPLLMPWVGDVNVDPLQACRSNGVFQDFYRVMAEERLTKKFNQRPTADLGRRRILCDTPRSPVSAPQIEDPSIPECSPPSYAPATTIDHSAAPRKRQEPRPLQVAALVHRR